MEEGDAVAGDFVASGGGVESIFEVPRDQGERLGERRRAKRMVQATILIVISLVVVIVGIVAIGESERYIPALDGVYTSHDKLQLEAGIFMTIIGTLALAGSFMFLMAEWKKS